MRALRDRRFIVLWEHNGWEGETWGLAIPRRQDDDDDGEGEELCDDELLSLLDAWAQAAEEDEEGPRDTTFSVTDGAPFADGYDLAGLGAMGDANPTSYSTPVSIVASSAIGKLRLQLRESAGNNTLRDLSIYKGVLSLGETEICALDEGSIDPRSLLDATSPASAERLEEAPAARTDSARPLQLELAPDEEAAALERVQKYAEVLEVPVGVLLGEAEGRRAHSLYLIALLLRIERIPPIDIG